jgi:general secretion pathway protein D
VPRCRWSLFWLAFTVLLGSCNQLPAIPLITSGSETVPAARPAAAEPEPIAPIPAERSAAQPRRVAVRTVAAGRQPILPATPVAETRVAPGGAISFNFANADVRQVLREILGEQLRLPYTVDPALHAAITADTGSPVARDAVLPMLENVLRASGVALLKVGDVYRAVPLAQASEQSIATVPPAAAASVGYGIRVLPLHYVPATEMQSILKAFVPTGGKLEVDGPHNTLIVSGPAADLDGFASLVRRFDVDWLAGKSIEIDPLQISRAQDVARDLQQMLNQDKDGKGPLSGVVRIVPVERLNSIIVISTTPTYLNEVHSWIRRLDLGGDQSTPRLFEYRVQNSRASDLARVLTRLFSPGAVSTVAPIGAPTASIVAMGAGPGATTTSGPGLASAFAASPTTAGASIAPPVTTSGTATSSTATGAPAIQPPPIGEAEKRMSEALTGGVELPANPQLQLPPVRVVADEKNNALVIYARPRDYEMILPIIEKLDKVPLQVLIEATIAQVTLNNKLQYGVQFFLTGPGEGRFSLTQATTGTLSTSDIAGVFPGFNYLVNNLASQRAVVNLLRSVSNVTVLSSPHLLVVDHQTAGLQVGAQVPIVVQSAQSVITSQAPIVNSVEYRNTGVILKVTPRVNSSGLITLDIDQEVSEVAQTTTSNIDSPTINDRHIATSVIVRDGETVALGGLIRDNTDNTKAGIPVLSELPGIGPLFRSTSDSRERDELIVLLTPRVIRNVNDARAMTADLTNNMQALKPLELRLRR